TALLRATAGAPVRYSPSRAAGGAPVAPPITPPRGAEAARRLTRQRALATHPMNAKLLAHATLQRVVLSCQA
ncbi:DNA polymerase III subunit delta', partial [Achromobacter spanius]